MSDPVSNAEIEDVLSSIRRLVSVDERADQRGEKDVPSETSEPSQTQEEHGASDKPVATEKALPKDDERLVLTQSFKVSPEEDEQVEDISENALGDLGERLTLGKWQVPLDSGVDDTADEAQHAASSAAVDDDWRDDGSDEAEAAEHSDDGDAQDASDVTSDDELPRPADENAEDDAQLKEWLTSEDQQAEASDIRQDEEAEDASDEDDALLEDAEAAIFGKDSDLAFEFAEPSSATEADDDAPRPEPVTSELEARIAEVEAAVAAREDQWEPDGESEDAYSGGQTDPLPWEDHDEQAMPMFFSRAAHDASDQASKNDGSSASETSEESDDGVEPEAITDPDEMPDESDVETAQDDSEDADRSRRMPDRFTASRAPESSDRDDSWYREDSDAVLDEDALRDLVSEIVRQELQGSLGERITRNVRKLVRREIHRAMMGQDLD